MKVGINISNTTLNDYYNIKNVDDTFRERFLRDITKDDFEYEYFNNENVTLYLFDDEQVDVNELSYIINSTIMKLYMNKKSIVVNNLDEIAMVLNAWKKYNKEI